MKKTHCCVCNKQINEGELALQRRGFTGFICSYKCYAESHDAILVKVDNTKVKYNEDSGSYGWDEE